MTRGHMPAVEFDGSRAGGVDVLFNGSQPEHNFTILPAGETTDKVTAEFATIFGNIATCRTILPYEKYREGMVAIQEPKEDIRDYLDYQKDALASHATGTMVLVAGEKPRLNLADRYNLACVQDMRDQGVKGYERIWVTQPLDTFSDSDRELLKSMGATDMFAAFGMRKDNELQKAS